MTPGWAGVAADEAELEMRYWRGGGCIMVYSCRLSQWVGRRASILLVF